LLCARGCHPPHSESVPNALRLSRSQAFQISGSPSSVYSHPGPVCAATSTPTSSGLTQARVCTPVSFTITARDEFSNQLTKDVGDFYVRLDANDGDVFRGAFNDVATLTYIPQSKYGVVYTSLGAGTLMRVDLLAGEVRSFSRLFS
jgi:hypothetical protein